jgi:hypothetical protein
MPLIVFIILLYLPIFTQAITHHVKPLQNLQPKSYYELIIFQAVQLSLYPHNLQLFHVAYTEFLKIATP